MLWLFYTFPPLPIYFNRQCFSNQYINVNIIFNDTSSTLQWSFSIDFSCVCNSIHPFSEFMLSARSARYILCTLDLDKKNICSRHLMLDYMNLIKYISTNF